MAFLPAIETLDAVGGVLRVIQCPNDVASNVLVSETLNLNRVH